MSGTVHFRHSDGGAACGAHSPQIRLAGTHSTTCARCERTRAFRDQVEREDPDVAVSRKRADLTRSMYDAGASVERVTAAIADQGPLRVERRGLVYQWDAAEDGEPNWLVVYNPATGKIEERHPCRDITTARHLARRVVRVGK